MREPNTVARNQVARNRSAGAALTLSLLLAAFALTGSSRPGLTEITAAEARRLNGAGWPGNDISWPQCPRGRGGYGLPEPSPQARLLVIGLTAGRPHSTNPCLPAQVRWATVHAVPTHAYVIVAWPTADQLRADATRGPWPAHTQQDRLGNVGYAQARSALETLANNAFRPPVGWLDVEPIEGRRWPTGTAAKRSANRALILGVMRGFADAGVAVGLYSYTAAWRDITGSWQLPTVPVWVTAGKAPRSNAVRMCRRPSFSGGPVHLAQWYDSLRDSDITCPPFRLVPVLPLLPATTA
jgi:hypothetical protein